MPFRFPEVCSTSGSSRTTEAFSTRGDHIPFRRPVPLCLRQSSEAPELATRSSVPFTRLQLATAEAEYLPLVGNAFDWVHMRSVLDHFLHRVPAIFEAHRVLRSGGKLLLGVHVTGGESPLREGSAEAAVASRLRRKVKYEGMGATLIALCIDSWVAPRRTITFAIQATTTSSAFYASPNAASRKFTGSRRHTMMSCL